MLHVAYKNFRDIKWSVESYVQNYLFLARFSKDTMRTTLCTLVFLFSLPWSLNGHLTTSNKNNKHSRKCITAEGLHYWFWNRKRGFTFKKHSDTTTYESLWAARDQAEDSQRWRRDIKDKEECTLWQTQLNYYVEHPETQMQDKVTQKKELQKPTESSRRPHTTSLLQTENATELNVFTKPSDATRADVLPEEKTSSGHSETQKATQETPLLPISLGSMMRKQIKQSWIATKPAQIKIFQQPSPQWRLQTNQAHMPHFRNSNCGRFQRTLSTNDVKTTEGKEITDKWTHTQGPELETSSMTKPTRIDDH